MARTRAGDWDWPDESAAPSRLACGTGRLLAAIRRAVVRWCQHLAVVVLVMVVAVLLGGPDGPAALVATANQALADPRGLVMVITGRGASAPTVPAPPPVDGRCGGPPC